MYNTDFLPQMEEFQKDLFKGYFDTELHENPQHWINLIPCFENENGEWIPIPKAEEKEK